MSLDDRLRANLTENLHAEHFADEIRIVGGMDDCPETERVLDAFRNVPREAFAGPGPWSTRSVFYDMALRKTPDADPRWLYHCVLVVLDEKLGINIGEPSFWARILARTCIRSDSRILQVGAGVGYYTAILDQLAGQGGKITAYEVDDALVKRARENLQSLSNVGIQQGNAAIELEENRPFDLIISFAGATHIPAKWISQLTPNGRILLPMTGTNGWGAMVLARMQDQSLTGKTLGRCAFYPCAGARNDMQAKRLDELLYTRAQCDRAQVNFSEFSLGAHIESVMPEA
jgi:protein-L-isoaspartate(D-aspartate) O-methyltransferase